MVSETGRYYKIQKPKHFSTKTKRHKSAWTYVEADGFLEIGISAAVLNLCLERYVLVLLYTRYVLQGFPCWRGSSTDGSPSHTEQITNSIRFGRQR